MNIKNPLSNKRKLPLENRRISTISFDKNNSKFGLLILSLAAAIVLLSVVVNNNSNALALSDTQQKQQQQQSGISTSKAGYSGINEISNLLSSYASGTIADNSFSRSSSSSSTTTIPYLVWVVDSLIGNLGKELSKIIQSSNNSTATLLVETHVINTNGGTRQASDFSNCIDTSSGGSNSLQCGTGSEGSSVGVSFDAGPYKVYQNPRNPVTGYSVSYSKDCSGVIKVGEVKMCTITYRDTSPTS